jgi:sodium-dependent dicarboxylate transporter 2/3/5
MAAFIGILGFGLSIFGFSLHHSILIGILAFLVTLWTNEGLPLGVVSLLPILLFPALDILPTAQTTSNYAKPIIFLFLGGFLLAIATEKIRLHEYIATKILTIFPSTPRGIIFSLASTSAILSAMLSNTTTALLLIPIASFLTTHTILKIRFILAIAYGASIGGIITPIGTPPNMILLGFMQSKGMEMIGFIQWVALIAPLAIIMLVLSSFVLSFNLHHSGHIRELSDTKAINAPQKRLLTILGALILLLFINSPIEPYYSGMGLNESGILLGFGLLMFVPKIGFLEWSDTKKVPYEIMFLFGAGFSIAQAFSHTGLAADVAQKLTLIADFSPWLLILCVAALITFTTEITSNTALISIALPIIFALGEMTAVRIELLMLAATICASYAFMLPIATPPNAIAMSTGVVKISTMARFGIVLNLLGIGLITVTALGYWQYFL